MPDHIEPEVVERVILPPDLRTLEGARALLTPNVPTDDQIEAHTVVNISFQILLENVWERIPEGAGKSLFVRSLNRARHDANSAIANHGA